MKVVFSAKYSWALMPKRVKISSKRVREDSAVYRESFRWFRRDRAPELCVSWRLGQELGWIIESPVDVRIKPVSDVEIDREALHQDPEQLATITGRHEFWQRESSCLGIERASWLRLYDFRHGSEWQSMFIPNGAGSIEWCLGWEMDIPSDNCAVIVPLPLMPKLGVPIGVLLRKSVAKLNGLSGFSLAIQPNDEILVRRGDPIARLIVCDSDILNPESEYV